MPYSNNQRKGCDVSRLLQIPKYEDFTKKLKLSLSEYADKIGVSYTKYFATKLGFKGDNATSQFSNHLNSNGKNLTIRELIRIIEVTKEESKPALDYLCEKGGFVCVEKAKFDKTDFNDLKQMLLSFNINQADISSSFLKAIDDNKLSNDEIKEQLDLCYQFRAQINQYEFALKERIDE